MTRIDGDIIITSPVLEKREAGGDDDGGEFSLVTKHNGRAYQRIKLERIFNRLWCDELAARGLDQVLLAIGHGEKPVGVEGPNVTGLEPSVHKDAGRFLRLVPVTVEN